MQGTKKKSKRWSMKDIRTIKNYVKVANNMGQPDHEGLKAAATHFGVTLNSVNLRWKRFNSGVHTGSLKGNTTKEPMNRKNRKYTKKQVVDAIIDDGGIQDFGQKQALTKELRRMVIDLMNTSGHIRGVSVDLSSKSFTVIF